MPEYFQSEDDLNFLRESLVQDFVLDIPLTGHPEGARTGEPPIFFSLRAFRDTSELISRTPHMSSFVSESVYSFLGESLFNRNEVVILPPLRKPSPESNVVQHPAATREYEKKRRRGAERASWVNRAGYSVLYAPFYIVSHENERSKDLFYDESNDPRYRALPILAPNLTLTQLEGVEYVSRDREERLTEDREKARVFVALWLSPDTERSRVQGWRTATRRGTNRFRMNLQDADTLAERARELLERNARYEKAGIVNPRLGRTRKKTIDSKGKNIHSRLGYVTTGKASVICASSPDAPDEDQYGDDDLGARTLKKFSEMLFSPGDLNLFTERKVNSIKMDVGEDGHVISYGRETEIQRKKHSHSVFGLEQPCDPDLGGLFAILELPEFYDDYFTGFSLEKRLGRPTLQQERRQFIHKRRPTRPEATHAIISPSGLVRIAPSLLHTSLITPRGMNPLDVKLSCRRLRSLKSQLGVVLSVETRPGKSENPFLVGGRNCAATTAPPHLRVPEDTPYDPEHPPYFLLDEPPLVENGTLTLVFRQKPDDHENPIPPIDNTEFIYSEE